MFDSYRQTAGYSPDASINEVVWSWINSDQASQAIVVEDDEGLLGFAHYRRFPPARRLYEQFGTLSESVTDNAIPHSGEATPS
ncbi:hypothetical protein [Pseudoclavibacter sp. 8L]|uniref:hypothetical protein n=1 Tax=Pseudoclavibacter sp. 8L TaxID=2653162 RepID=UPI00135A83BB|nr:hypothetical protein [Pseudoclavibacter sp. 8L]